MNDDMEITKKLDALPVLTEEEMAQLRYDAALKAMNQNPSKETIAAFGDANRHLFEVKDAYRIGQRLKDEYEADRLIRVRPMKRVLSLF